MKTTVEIGDRFGWHHDGINIVIEFVNSSEVYCIFSDCSTWTTGESFTFKQPHIEDILQLWAFAGNFSKSSNFDELYNLLNE